MAHNNFPEGNKPSREAGFNSEIARQRFEMIGKSLLNIEACGAYLNYSRDFQEFNTPNTASQALRANGDQGTARTYGGEYAA